MLYSIFVHEISAQFKMFRSVDIYESIRSMVRCHNEKVSSSISRNLFCQLDCAVPNDKSYIHGLLCYQLYGRAVP